MSNQVARYEEEETEEGSLGLYGDSRHFAGDFSTDDIIYKCPNCASKNTGYEEKAASLLTVIASVMSLLIFKLYAFLILPLVIESTKTVTKKCVKCDHILDKQELLSVPSLTDKILSFKCGSCALVISRKYALVILAVLIGIWFFLPSHEAVVNPGGLHLDKTKWEDYVLDCGKQVILNNQVRAKRVFEQKYAQNYISWTGVYFQNIPREKIQDPLVGAVVLIKMNPSDSSTLYPDIQLVFSYATAGKYKQLLHVLQPGDVVEFKALVRALGDEFKYHHLDAVNIERTGQTIDLATIPTMNYTGNLITNLRRTGKSDQYTDKQSEKERQQTEKEKEADKVKQDTQSTQDNVNQDNQDNASIDGDTSLKQENQDNVNQDSQANQVTQDNQDNASIDGDTSLKQENQDNVNQDNQGNQDNQDNQDNASIDADTSLKQDSQGQVDT